MDAVKLLGALLGNNATGGNLLGSVLGGGGNQQAAPQQSGVADLLKGMLGGGGSQMQSAGMGDMLGGLLGGRGGTGKNALGGLLMAAVAKQFAGGSGGGSPLGLLGGMLGGDEQEPEVSAPERESANDQATILIRAMCNAAKSDGQVDRDEQQKIIDRLGELDQQEIDFVQQELSSPLDVAGFARSVPQEMAAQVYALSVMTVKVDTRQEVQYLTQLAQALGLNQQTLDAIHQQVGVG